MVGTKLRLQLSAEQPDQRQHIIFRDGMSDVMAGLDHGADIGGNGVDQQAVHIEDDGLGSAG